MNFKKRVNGSWTDIPHYIHNTSTDTLTTLPADLYADGANATATIKGNLSQSGTPSPSSPVYPSETGDKTANLLDVTLFHNGYHINSQGIIETFTGRIATTTPIDVSNYTSVTFSYTTTRDNDNFIYATFNGSTLIERVAGKTSGFAIDTTNCDKLYLCLYNLSSQVSTADIITAMLNEGSTAQTYEPYGYKIPILSGGTTTPVYLGEVQSTRQIKKLVLTGEEQVNMHPTIASWFQIYLTDIVIDNLELCTHYKPSLFTAATIQNGEILVGKQTSFNDGRIIIRDTSYSTATDFKTYLQQQYAAGTPVTVWYGLATPTTGIINEPIRKIGNYADSVSVTGIPTTGTAESFDVGTTLKPSEVDLTYHGWHEHSDTKFTG